MVRGQTEQARVDPVQFHGSQDYAFVITFHRDEIDNRKPQVGLWLTSPRSVFMIPAQAVERDELLGLVLLFRAMLDGLVEVADRESEEGYASFAGLEIDVRQVPAADADIAFEVVFSDCGCEDEATYCHQGLVGVYMERQAFLTKVDTLEAQVRLLPPSPRRA